MTCWRLISLNGSFEWFSAAPGSVAALGLLTAGLLSLRSTGSGEPPQQQWHTGPAAARPRD